MLFSQIFQRLTPFHLPAAHTPTGIDVGRSLLVNAGSALSPREHLEAGDSVPSAPLLAIQWSPLLPSTGWVAPPTHRMCPGESETPGARPPICTTGLSLFSIKTLIPLLFFLPWFHILPSCVCHVTEPLTSKRCPEYPVRQRTQNYTISAVQGSLLGEQTLRGSLIFSWVPGWLCSPQARHQNLCSQRTLPRVVTQALPSTWPLFVNKNPTNQGA